ncbi:phosphatidylglycerophosphatase A family protein [Chitinophaga japonensis]|uniref:Phosphatidylglycerophosphatase A n=1 Tax=Chitinophaga japonensis TaxID=104662 RepID=A0A562T444_CHIJA|nr:phosphatidylglycerophosphatase A [Chitinophaga japonensis]TWI88048.1 phosphatidylglycerophosphatase A [Chitinophaga japonensis]
MNRLYQLISTSLGIGYIGKGAGTAAAVVTAFCWYMLQAGEIPDIRAQWLVTLLIVVLGTWSAAGVEKQWGKDHQRVVIDEVAGMCISLLMVPLSVPYIAAGLILFRFFDIAKPLYIRRAERLPGGWGVMLDDVLAGVYTNLLLQVVYRAKLF